MESLEEGEYSDNVELLRPDESRAANRMKAVAKGNVVKALALVLVLYLTGNAVLLMVNSITNHGTPDLTGQQTGAIVAVVADASQVINTNDVSSQPVPPMIAAAVLAKGEQDDAFSHIVPVDEAFDEEETSEEDWSDNEPEQIPPVLTPEQTKARERQQKCDALVDGFNIKNEKSIDAARCKAIMEACGLPNCAMNVDVVILWVNGSDPRQACAIKQWMRSVKYKMRRSPSFAMNLLFGDMHESQYTGMFQ